jgi:hypothetical protein
MDTTIEIEIAPDLPSRHGRISFSVQVAVFALRKPRPRSAGGKERTQAGNCAAERGATRRSAAFHLIFHPYAKNEMRPAATGEIDRVLHVYVFALQSSPCLRLKSTA